MAPENLAMLLLLSVFFYNWIFFILKLSYSYNTPPQCYNIYSVISFGVADVNWRKPWFLVESTEIVETKGLCRFADELWES